MHYIDRFMVLILSLYKNENYCFYDIKEFSRNTWIVKSWLTTLANQIN